VDKELLQIPSNLFNQKLKPIEDDIKYMKNKVESITASNWKHITKLKSVK